MKSLGSKGNIFNQEFSRENQILRGLFIVQVFSIIVGLITWLVFGDKAAIFTLFLAITVIIVTTITMSYINLKYQSSLTFLEKKELAEKITKVKNQLSNVNLKIATLENENKVIEKSSMMALRNLEITSKKHQIELANQLVNLENSEKTKLQTTLIQKQNQHVKNSLLSAHLKDANITGIGQKLTERMIISGIISAVDISMSRLSGIPGLGEIKTQELINWQRRIEIQAQKTALRKLDDATEKIITDEFRLLKEKIIFEQEGETIKLTNSFNSIKETTSKQVSENIDDIERFRESFSEQKKALDNLVNDFSSYSDVTFINFLLSSLDLHTKTTGFRKQLIVGGILSAIVLGTIYEGGMAAKSTSSIIIAAIPTSTPTPSATWTPTNTLKPSATRTFTLTITSTYTFTPTITLTPTITSTATITNTPTITITPTITLPPVIGADCIPPTERVTGIVTEVINGDTIKVNIDGKIFSVRYIGIDAPETEFSADYYGPQATYKNRSLVEGRKIYLFRDVSDVDDYNRLFRYVIVGNTFVNYELVKSGYAYASTYPPDVACSIEFHNAQKNARTGLVGLWAPTPVPTVYQYIAPTAPQGNCDPSYPTVCIPPPPPDLDCPDISYRDFRVYPPDPHRFDGDHDGIGCET